MTTNKILSTIRVTATVVILLCAYLKHRLDRNSDTANIFHQNSFGYIFFLKTPVTKYTEYEYNNLTNDHVLVHPAVYEYILIHWLFSLTFQMAQFYVFGFVKYRWTC